MRKSIVIGLLASAPLLALAASEGDARACGACIHPPTQQTPTVVTDHRMVLAVSAHQTTLYDQIEYSGAPESFAWVLPVAGTVTVGVSSDRLFSTIDQQTQTIINAPPLTQQCPGPPPGCATPGSFVGSSSGGGGDDGVTVINRQVVGPYDTVQLSADDPGALDKWLTDNGYALTDAEKPVIAAYVAEHFDFLAVKLLPTAGVAAMQPIRVTSTGTSTTLPLRMIAVGAGATVGITLWIVGEGNYAPTNFDLFTIKADELTWDWNRGTSDYTSIRAAKTAAGGGKVWELESAIDVPTSAIEKIVLSSDAADDYPVALAVDGGADAGSSDAGTPKTPYEARSEDLAVLFEGVPNGTARITRIRADLSHDALSADLVLGAAPDQAVVSNTRQVTKGVDPPACPTYSCTGDGSSGTDGTQTSSSGGDDGGCSTGPRVPRVTAGEWIGAGALALGLAVAKLARRKNRRK